VWATALDGFEQTAGVEKGLLNWRLGAVREIESSDVVAAGQAREQLTRDSGPSVHPLQARSEGQQEEQPVPARAV
jgi:hypothetical protein